MEFLYPRVHRDDEKGDILAPTMLLSTKIRAVLTELLKSCLTFVSDTHAYAHVTCIQNSFLECLNIYPKLSFIPAGRNVHF